MLIDISSGFMQTCPHLLRQHFSEPETIVISLARVNAAPLLLSLSLSIIFHEILIMQVVTIGVTLNNNKPTSFAQ